MKLSAKRSLKGSLGSRSQIIGKITVSTIMEDNTQTYILVDEDGNEIPAVLVDEEVVLTATPNDIRIGTTAVTEVGVTTGEKIIPAYNTTKGVRVILPGQSISIPIRDKRSLYDYSKLQVLICAFNTNVANSVATEKVAFGDKVYDVMSIEPLSTIIKDPDSQAINLGIENDSGEPCVIRYITCKEIE